MTKSVLHFRKPVWITFSLVFVVCLIFGMAISTTQPASAAQVATPTPGVAKPLPADHEGRTTCNDCHTNNIGPANPADHEGRTDAMCVLCHKASGSGDAAAPAGETIQQNYAGSETCAGCHEDIHTPMASWTKVKMHSRMPTPLGRPVCSKPPTTSTSCARIRMSTSTMENMVSRSQLTPSKTSVAM